MQTLREKALTYVSCVYAPLSLSFLNGTHQKAFSFLITRLISLKKQELNEMNVYRI